MLPTTTLCTLKQDAANDFVKQKISLPYKGCYIDGWTTYLQNEEQPAAATTVELLIIQQTEPGAAPVFQQGLIAVRCCQMYWDGATNYVKNNAKMEPLPAPFRIDKDHVWALLYTVGLANPHSYYLVLNIRPLNRQLSGVRGANQRSYTQ